MPPARHQQCTVPCQLADLIGVEPVALAILLFAGPAATAQLCGCCRAARALVHPADARLTAGPADADASPGVGQKYWREVCLDWCASRPPPPDSPAAYARQFREARARGELGPAISAPVSAAESELAQLVHHSRSDGGGCVPRERACMRAANVFCILVRSQPLIFDEANARTQ